MKIKGITEAELRSIVAFISETQYAGNIVFKREPEWKGNFCFFTLTVKDSSKAGGRRAASGRRVAAACWHAHRDIMQAIFDQAPAAILVTALARYEGAQGFSDTFPETGFTSIGSMANPLYMGVACECDGEWS
jgi:hypothetical protein